mmetsp:Transcript_106236/g.226830  ORF Transcript_106236/g.226830 Transcript_106236/m.226830 type:complete len:665 (+) Transcript_106236:89-2083(+)
MPVVGPDPVQELLELLRKGEGKSVMARSLFRSIVYGRLPQESLRKNIEDALYQMMKNDVDAGNFSMPSPHHLVSLLRQNQAGGGKEPMYSVFNHIITKFRNEKAPQGATCTLVFQSECGVPGDEWSYNPAMEVLQDERDGTYVIEIFKFIEDAGVFEKFKRKESQSHAVCYMVKALLSSRSLRDGFDQAVGVCEAYGLSSDPYVLKEFADYFANRGRWREVLRVLEACPKECNKWIANSLLKALKERLKMCEASPKSALEAIDACLDKNRCMPDDNIDALTTLAHEAEHATFRFDRECREQLKGVSQWCPTVKHVLEIVSKQNISGGFVKIGESCLYTMRKDIEDTFQGDDSYQFDQAKYIFYSEQFRNLVRIDLPLCNTFLDACAVARKPEEAEQVLKEMEQQQITPNARSLNALMRAFAKAGMHLKAKGVLDRMDTDGIEPNEVTRCIVAESFIDEQNPNFKEHDQCLFSKSMILILVPKLMNLKTDFGLENAMSLYKVGIEKEYWRDPRRQVKDNTADLHDHFPQLAQLAWMFIKAQLKMVDTGDFQEPHFTADKDIRVDVGNTGHKLRDFMMDLLESEGFAPRVEKFEEFGSRSHRVRKIRRAYQQDVYLHRDVKQSAVCEEGDMVSFGAKMDDKGHIKAKPPFKLVRGTANAASSSSGQ